MVVAMKANVCFAVCVTICAVYPNYDSGAGNFRVGVGVKKGSVLTLSLDGQTDVYFQVRSSEFLAAANWPVVDMIRGVAAPLEWSAAISNDSRHYLRILRVPRSNARDEDGDALDDAYELDHETDPLDPDTDGDGMQDGAEVAQGFDPLSSNLAANIVIHAPAKGGMLP